MARAAARNSVARCCRPSSIIWKLVVDDYDASKELAEGWRRLHKNLLVYPLIS